MRYHRLFSFLALTIILGVAPLLSLAQTTQIPDRDPCGFPDTLTLDYHLAAMANWGYGYDSLLADVNRWDMSPFVRVDTAGSSVLGRKLFVLTIQDTTVPAVPRKRVWIHARTHPNEVQGTWVTNRMIALLLSDTPLGRTLRDSCVFCVLPMLNPDGVELGLGRQNANNIDIESNWSAVPGEPEVQSLRGWFTGLMATSNPILLALNVHSASDCKRYFVYHSATGTSTGYAAMEQRFIDGVRTYFPGGFQPWNYMITWTSGAPTVYPESWFWYNHHEAVLALTYEDMNCPQAGSYDSTAFALLSGIKEYLLTPSSSVVRWVNPREFLLLQNYPNPFNPRTVISCQWPVVSDVRLVVYDLLGREVAVLVNERKAPGSYNVEFDGTGLSSGVYVYRLTAGPNIESRKMILMK